MIKQSTGEDWKDAEISLSTAQPDIGASPPQLGVHHIGFLRPRAMAFQGSFARAEYDPTIEDSYFDEDDECYEELSASEECMARTTDVSKKSKSKRRSYSPPPLEVEVAKVSCVNK